MRKSRLLVFSLSLSTFSFGACNCDNDLHGFPGALKGLVCASDSGAILTGIKVTIDDGGRKVDVTTDQSGNFDAEGLDTGKASIVIHDPTGDRTASVFIDPGKTARFSDSTCHPPVSQLGEIDGCVCDDAVGNWVVGANVWVVVDATGAVFSTGTDPNGCFALTGVPLGAQTLKIQKDSYYKEVTVTLADTTPIAIPSPASCEAPPPPAGSGTVVGRVCAPDGTTWLGGATVYVDRADGTRAQTTTDADGHYTLTGVPAGNETVNISKGSFNSSTPVTVTADQTTTIPDDQCALTSPAVKIAVVTGDYDHVQDVLSDLGVDPANVDTYEGANFSSAWVSGLLDDYATLSQYDIVFLNCGLWDARIVVFPDQTAIDNIKQFVQDGGSVYASDWAYSVVETAWPDMIDFRGADNSFSGTAGPKFGDTVNGLPGTIIDANLATGMGSSSIALDYQLPEWVAMQAAAPGVTVYITADAPLQDGTTLTNVPHTVGFNAGAGRVLYTSFHQEPGVNQNQERVLQLLMFEL